MAKRGQNEGTICKRDDGRWVAVLNLGYRDGKRWRKSFYGKTRKEVQEQLTATLREQQQGLPVITERQTVAQFLDRWLADVVKPTVRPKTYHSYQQLVRLHLKPALGHHQLAKLDPQHVQALINAKLAEGLSPRTVQYLHAVLRRALGQALKWNLVPRNVARLVDPPRVERPEMLALTPEQARRFLDAVGDDRLGALYSVAVALGLRQSEILGLRWEDVDFEQRTLRVRVQLLRIDGAKRLVEPKTRQSRRTLPLPATIVAGLRAHRSRQLQERLLAGARWEGNGWDLVFTTTRGGPLDARHLVRAFKDHLVRAGLPDIRFHDLRHSCASLLVAQGLHPRVVMEILGHSTITLTMNTYSHVMPALQREAADMMDNLLLAGR